MGFLCKKNVGTLQLVRGVHDVQKWLWELYFFTLKKKRLSGRWEGILFLSSITQRRITEKTGLDSSLTCAVKHNRFQQRMFWSDIREMYSLEEKHHWKRYPQRLLDFLKFLNLRQMRPWASGSSFKTGPALSRRFVWRLPEVPSNLNCPMSLWKWPWVTATQFFGNVPTSSSLSSHLPNLESSSLPSLTIKTTSHSERANTSQEIRSLLFHAPFRS